MGLKEQVLDHWEYEETVKSMTLRLNSNANVLRVVFNRLEQEGLIHETDKKDENGFKIYRKGLRYSFEGIVTSDDFHGEAPDVYAGQSLLSTLLKLYGKKVKVTIEVLE